MKSNRHHYLPQFYIKGFTNTEGKLFVFDKDKATFKSKEFSPKQMFFEWNRNSLFENGEQDDVIEKLYGDLESRLAPAYLGIIKQKGRIIYQPKDIFSLLILVSLTYWRSPVVDDDIEKHVKSISYEDSMIKIVNAETGEDEGSDIFERIRDKESFAEFYRLLLPINDYLGLNMSERLKNWQIYNAATDVRLHILGDRPLVFNGPVRNNILETELIFPLDSGTTLYHTNGNRLKEISAVNRLMVDVAIFIQSNRYVVGPNKEYLNQVKQLAEEYKTEHQKNLLLNEIFTIFEIKHSD